MVLKVIPKDLVGTFLAKNLEVFKFSKIQYMFSQTITVYI